MATDAGDRAEIGIGLIGAGWMGTLHALAYRHVHEHYPECPRRPRLVVVADPQVDRARQVAEALGFERWTADPQEVIDDPDVEAVSLTTPNHMHLPLATAVVECGKHLWGEKPLGRYPQDTAAIVQAVEAAGVRATVGYNYRHAPAVAYARALIAAGDLGDVRSYRGEFLVDYAAHPRRGLSWRFSEQISGLGVLGDLMSHVVDMAGWLVGPLGSVTATADIQIARRPRPGRGAADQFSLVEDGDLAEVENEDYVASLARFANGAPASFEVSRVNVGHPLRMAFEVRGSAGALAWDFQRMNELRLYHWDPVGGDSGWRDVYAGPQHGDFARFQPEAGNSMSFSDLKTIEAARFLESIAAGRDLGPSARDALATAEVLEAMRRSFEAGTWQQVEPLTASAIAGA